MRGLLLRRQALRLLQALKLTVILVSGLEPLAFRQKVVHSLPRPVVAGRCGDGENHHQERKSYDGLGGSFSDFTIQEVPPRWRNDKGQQRADCQSSQVAPIVDAM